MVVINHNNYFMQVNMTYFLNFKINTEPDFSSQSCSLNKIIHPGVLIRVHNDSGNRHVCAGTDPLRHA